MQLHSRTVVSVLPRYLLATEPLHTKTIYNQKITLHTRLPFRTHRIRTTQKFQAIFGALFTSYLLLSSTEREGVLMTDHESLSTP